VAYTNEDRARERLQRARSFLEKAHALMLQDDLVYRSALDDAVSAIKNNLQGYLLQRIVLMPPGHAPIPWQEAVAGNRMPELLRACSEAGLDLRGLDREIRKLNDERNSRTHDDPLRRVDTAQARQAVDLALLLHRRVQDALKAHGGRSPVPSVNLATRLPEPELARVGLGRGVVAPARAGNGAAPGAQALAARSAGSVAVATAPAERSAGSSTQPAPAVPAAAAKSAEQQSAGAEDDADEDDDTAERAAVQDAVRRRWFRRVVVRGGGMAALLVIGTAAGVLLTLFAAGLDLRAGSGSHTSAPPGATATIAANTLYAAGALLVGVPVCQAGHPSVSLRNTGASPIQFSAGSPDNPGATFAAAQGTAPSQTLFGTAAPNAVTTLTVADAPGDPAHYHIVVTAPGGSVELPATSC
jgi:hypothetical protein